jgi:putative hydrolase
MAGCKTMIKIVADLHIHTVASNHAFSTVHDIVAEAHRKGLRMIGITDHGPACPGGPHPYYFRNLSRIPKDWEGLAVRCGIEDDIIDEHGTLGLADKDRMCLDYIMVGLHPNMWISGLDIPTRTQTVITALERNPAIRVLTHPVNPWERLELEPVIETCKATDTCIELNNTKLQSVEDVVRLLELTVKYEVPIVVNSDAHISFEVGVVDAALALLEKIGYPENLVVNTSLDKIKKYLGI